MISPSRLHDALRHEQAVLSHLYASPAVAQTLGIPQDAFIGKTWQELGFPSEVTARCDIERDTVSTHSSHRQGELIFPTEVGQPSAVHDYVLSPVPAHDGTVEAVLVTARDISERLTSIQVPFYTRECALTVSYRKTAW